MDALSWNLLLASAGVAVAHTALGPDHYLPFVVLARARRWSVAKTMLVTTACGFGHVGSSLLLGGLGIVAGMAIAGVEHVEGLRGDLAGWALVAVGCAYALWGIRRALRQRRGLELHRHGHHVHVHAHGGHEHAHAQLAGGGDPAPPRHEAGVHATFWALFLVFVLGPCEPLIPLFVVPASEGRWGLAALVGGVFAVATIATMLAITAALLLGVRRLPLGPLERWSHAMAGAVVAASGLAILFLGL